ncbi:hypothetical protein AB4571_02660 [Vibrio breoganii]
MTQLKLIQIGQYILAIALISLSSFSFACQVNESLESERLVVDYLLLDGQIGDQIVDAGLKVILKREEGNLLL